MSQYTQKTLEDGCAQATILSFQVPEMEVYLYEKNGEFISSFQEMDGKLIFTYQGGKKLTPIPS
jgi:hypothetical protein